MKTIREIHDSFDRGALRPSVLVEECLKNITASPLNAFITVCAERAREQARRADQILKADGKIPRTAQPLFGIPMGLKDNLALSGVRLTCGSRVLENYVSPYTATAVSKVEAAGAVILGKLNMDEFGMGGANENSAFGPVLHPTHPDRVPGGSSGGAAAAVRAGLCVAALGSDTGGSVRLPANYCGVVGLKPTYGAVSRYGLVAFASSLDQVGPITSSAEDAARIFDVIQARDEKDSTSVQAPEAAIHPSLGGLRIGIPDEYFGEGLNPEIAAAIRCTLGELEKRGAKLLPISLPDSRHAVSAYYLIAMSEASSNLARFDGVRYGVRPPVANETADLATFYKATRALFGAEVKRRILLGTFALSSGYADAFYHRASAVRKQIEAGFTRAFETVDVITSPVSPTTAYRRGEISSDPLQSYLNDIFTVSANLAGIPAISFPCGTDTQGLPIGIQFMAPRFSEAVLLGLGRALEKIGGRHAV